MRMARSARATGVAVAAVLLASTHLALAAEPPLTPVAPASVVLPPDLDRVLRDYEAAWRGRDAVALAALFAEDGFVLPHRHAPVRGRAAIAAYYRGHGGPLFLRAFHFAVDGAVAYILGGYAGEAGAPDDGKFTLTLRKSGTGDGRWWIVSDMDNGNRPPNGNAAP